MRQSTYKDIPALLKEKENFEGNSMRAEWLISSFPKDRSIVLLSWEAAMTDPELSLYIVYSYATPIAWYIPGLGARIPDKKYSTTTSRHQNLCRTYL